LPFAGALTLGAGNGFAGSSGFAGFAGTRVFGASVLGVVVTPLFVVTGFFGTHLPSLRTSPAPQVFCIASGAHLPSLPRN
jgi:hypothetical protein